MSFQINDRVVVRHQLDLGVCVVVDPHEPTDVRFYKGRELVDLGHYVRINAGKKKGLGYHESSLQLVTEDQHTPVIYGSDK